MRAGKGSGAIQKAVAPLVEALETRTHLSVNHLVQFGNPTDNLQYFDVKVGGSVDIADNTLISEETFSGPVYEIPAGNNNDDITVKYVRAQGSAAAHYDIRQSARTGLVRLTAPALTGFRVIGGQGNDTIIIANQPGDPLLNNTIYGGNGGDAIFTGGGNDRIFAGAGHDLVNSGDGKDTVYGEAGDDSIRGAGGSDLLDGGDGYDTIRGDSGNDHLFGGANPDRLRGSTGNDTLDGGGGRDLLAGELGDDSLSGGSADDVIDGGLGQDILRGGPGHDEISVSDSDHDNFDASEISAGEAIDADAMRAGELHLGGPVTYPPPGSGTISPTGSSGGVTISNGGGAVATVGAITAGTIQDVTITGGKLDLSNNKLIATGGLSTSAYDGVTGLLQSGRNAGTTLSVATASDAEPGGATDTALWSGQTVSGTDTLVMYTYGGDANLDGKIGIDDYNQMGWYNGDFNYDGKINVDDYTIVDGTIGTTGWPFNGATGVSAVSVQPIEINGTAKADRIIVYSGASGIEMSINGVVKSTYARPFRISGNGGDDVISIETSLLASYPVTINGGAGNDTIYGNAEADRIFAGDGNDVVNGNDGRDTIYGESGDDSLRGGGGSDLCDGGDGIDTVRGDAGNDNLAGGANPDRLRGSAGNDTLDGGGGRDLLAGELGDDSLSGGAGEDVCDGGAGTNILRGDSGYDSIVCNDNDDVDFQEMNDGESATTQNLVVDNAGSLTKTGAGTLTLSGANAFVNNGNNANNLTVAGGVLQIASNTVPTSVSLVNVSDGGGIHFAADNFNAPTMDLRVSAGGIFQFDTATGSATIGSLSADANSYLVFNVSPAGYNDLHIAKADGLNLKGAVIKANVSGNLIVGSRYPLISFTGIPPVLDFVLAPVKDTTKVYTLTVDKAAGQIVLNVAHR